MTGALQLIARLQAAPVPPVPPCKNPGVQLEASPSLAVPCVPPVPPQTHEVLNQCESTAQKIEWLTQLAALLRCTPDYLLEHGYVDRHDLAEQHQQQPWRVARLIRTDPRWRQPSKHYVQACEGKPAAEIEVFREQYARAREDSHTNPHTSAAWLAARDAYHRHAVGGCPNCYPRGNRHCGIGIELRARYDHETHALEVRNAERDLSCILLTNPCVGRSLSMQSGD